MIWYLPNVRNARHNNNGCLFPRLFCLKLSQYNLSQSLYTVNQHCSFLLTYISLSLFSVAVSLVRANSTTLQGFWTLHKLTIGIQEMKFKAKSSSDVMLAICEVFQATRMRPHLK